MKEGDIIVFIDTEQEYKIDFTIGEKYVIKEYGEMNDYSWIVVCSDYGQDWELSTKSFKLLSDKRDEKLNNIGI